MRPTQSPEWRPWPAASGSFSDGDIALNAARHGRRLANTQPPLVIPGEPRNGSAVVRREFVPVGRTFGSAHSAWVKRLIRPCPSADGQGVERGADGRHAAG